MATAVKERVRRQEPSRYSGYEQMFIDGRWRRGRGEGVAEDRDPYTNSVLVQIPLASADDLDEAYRGAAAAQPQWAAMLPEERAAVIRRAAMIMEARRDEIVDWLVHESGSTRIKARLEWDYAHGVTIEASTFPSRASGALVPTSLPGKESRVYRQPVGVVGMISPWNFPFHLSSRSVAPALALGNAVVIKPASDTPVTGGLLLAKIYEEAGIPPGVLNVVIGRGSDIGDAFVLHPVPRVISFTGSTPVGKHIAELAARGDMLKRVALELGGNSPTIVLDDADLDLAVHIAAFGKFLHQGQICMAINRLIVDAKVHDEFVERFTSYVRGLKVGDPNDENTVIGPVVNKQQLEAHVDHVRRAKEEGARQLLGGEPRGLVFPPHIFADVTNEMSVAREELFGPIAPILRADGEEQAVEIANDTTYGLSASVVTRDVERGNRIARRIQAGMTHVNDSPVNDVPTCPFGGEKNSGIGRYNGEWVLDEFTTVHWVSVQHEPPHYPF